MKAIMSITPNTINTRRVSFASNFAWPLAAALRIHVMGAIFD